jgi:hypothetical protein
MPYRLSHPPPDALGTTGTDGRGCTGANWPATATQAKWKRRTSSFVSAVAGFDWKKPSHKRLIDGNDVP